MRKTDFFTVQRCRDPSTLTFDPPVSVEAESPLEAAEKALGESFSVVGDRALLAGRVLQLGEDYRTKATMVFKPR